MLKKAIKITTSLALSLALTTPAFAASGGKQATGTILGAIGGGLLGSQFGKGKGRLISTAIGTLLGSQLGSSIGHKMDSKDRRLANDNAIYALESRPDSRVSRWRNPNNNHHGNFVVTRTKEYPRTNKVCRDYVHTVVIDGKEEKIHGRACRNVRDTRAAWTVEE